MPDHYRIIHRGSSTRRWMWTSPKETTQPWKPRTFFGCDEWHNHSWSIGLPFLGYVTWFYDRRKFSVTGEPHLWAASYVETEDGTELVYAGRIVDDCYICQGMLPHLLPRRSDVES